MRVSSSAALLGRAEQGVGEVAALGRRQEVKVDPKEPHLGVSVSWPGRGHLGLQEG